MWRGLTEEQLKARRAGIGGSDAAAILAGGEAWVELWKDKTGRSTPKAIMSEWDSALRHHTEELQCDWYEHRNLYAVFQRGAIAENPDWPIIRCTLDGFLEEPVPAVFQAKHISSFVPGNPMDWCVEHYAPQVNHEMLATRTDKAIMSVIIGMAEPQWIDIDRDPFFCDAYLARCKEFWAYVESDTCPPSLTGSLSAPEIPITKMREVDFQGNNQFANFAAEWLANKNSAKKFETATTGLKKMIEPDVRRGHGYGIEITRAKNHALTVKETKSK